MVGRVSKPVRLGDNVLVVVAVGLITIFGATLLTLVVCTGLGARRRGYSIPLAVFAGLTFPGAWVVWYVQDEEVGSTI